MPAILRQYSRYFIGERYVESFAQGILALERDWHGELLTNSSVEATLASFQRLEKDATPADLKNWRFQQGLFRAYYDAYIRQRLLFETSLEQQAMEQLRDAPAQGSIKAMDAAANLLSRATSQCVSQSRRERIDRKSVV